MEYIKNWQILLYLGVKIVQFQMTDAITSFDTVLQHNEN